MCLVYVPLLPPFEMPLPHAHCPVNAQLIGAEEPVREQGEKIGLHERRSLVVRKPAQGSQWLMPSRPQNLSILAHVRMPRSLSKRISLHDSELGNGGLTSHASSRNNH